MFSAHFTPNPLYKLHYLVISCITTPPIGIQVVFGIFWQPINNMSDAGQQLRQSRPSTYHHFLVPEKPAPIYSRDT